jgi:hypothetical protein
MGDVVSLQHVDSQPYKVDHLHRGVIHKDCLSDNQADFFDRQIY